MTQNLSPSKLINLFTVYLVSTGILIGGIFAANSASALNGFSYFLTCASCATSSDFINIASTQARTSQSSGLYIVTSATNPETAYVQITGQLQNVGDGDQRPVWRFQITSTLLVDASGNSLAGLTEASLEADFQTFDQAFYGVTRGSGIGNVKVPSATAVSWIGIAEGLEVLEATISSLVYQQFNVTQIPLGTTVTCVFPDGSKAQFTKVYLRETFQWVFNGLAWDKNGNPVDVNGHPISNPNTSGSSAGSGSVNLGGGSAFSAAGAGDCLYITTATFNGDYYGGEFHFAAC